ncbi:alpha/beta hydrolase [Hyphococcus luteus]|uniref:Uncharacterized protein n=1 Tax=Hyphococcus luteus TaxID=2058213 RepID=A0A2S7K557_9PROT|nr:alpha/beta hydrolase [Marinicaulis flavus]PQA87606.1 hypothetical protein CW354_11030 [Marinicaulis flavus]
MPRTNFLISLILALTASSASAGEGPLVIEKQGYFYTSGQEYDTEVGKVIADRMYVEFQIPAKKKHPYPVVFYHGGGSTGAYWGMTPDGREGWREYFLRKGYAVYITDAPMIGRSGYNSLVDPELIITPHNPEAAERMFTNTEETPLWPQASKHTQFPGTGKRGDPIFEAFVSRGVPTVEALRPGNVPPPLEVVARTDKLVQKETAKLLEKIGPAIIVTHSRSGTFGWLIADARPELVKAVVAVEPNGPPFVNALPGSDLEDIARPYGPTYAPLTFDPPVDDPAEIAPVERLAPADEDLIGCWPMAGEQRTLPNLKDVPVLIVTGEASYHAQYDHCTAEFLQDAGVNAVHIPLGSVGVHGNSHVMMSEKNSDAVAGVIADWLDDHVK